MKFALRWAYLHRPNRRQLFKFLFVIGLALLVYAAAQRYDNQQSNKLKQDNFKSCKRGNTLRHQINAGDAVLHAVLLTVTAAAQAREKVDTTPKAKALDRHNATLYANYADAFKGVKLVDCRIVILHEHPKAPAGT